MCISVARYHRDDLADLGLAEDQRVAVGACNVDSAGLPLVADGTMAGARNAVGVSQRIGGGQGLPLRRCAADRDSPGGQIVDVGDAGSCTRCYGLTGALCIRITCYHCDDLAHLRLAQQQLVGVGACNVDSAGLPLVADGARASERNAVCICLDVCRQGLALRWGAADRDCPGG